MTQYARPDGDTAAGAWTYSTGATLYGCIDEASYDEADYIQLNNSAGSTCKISLSGVSDPGVGTGHQINLRVKKAGTGTVSLTCALYEGATERMAATSVTLTTSYATVNIALTEAQANAISSYANLDLWFAGVCNASGRYVYIAWAEFQVPSAPTNYPQAVSGGITPSGALTKTVITHQAGAITPSGALQKLVNAVRKGAITPTGLLSKLTSKFIGGSIAPSGIAQKNVITHEVGAVTPQGSLSLNTTKMIGGTLSMSGDLTAVKSGNFSPGWAAYSNNDVGVS